MKQHKLFIFIVCVFGLIVPELNLSAQEAFRPEDIDIIDLPLKRNPIPSQQKTIVKDNIDKKRKPELYTDFKRVKGGFVGVNKINQETASHRQINYRLSEMNTAGNWTKIEIVDADMMLKKNTGYYLLQPFQDSFKEWALYPLRLNDICSIDLEYDPKEGMTVTRETAKDADGNVVYIGGYKYSVDPSVNQTVVSVTYTQLNDAALFKYEETKASTIRYTYKGDSIQDIDLVDLDGKVLDSDFWLFEESVIDSIVKMDKYSRVDSVMYYYHGKKYETDSIHKKEYRYDAKGNILYEKWTNIAGKVRYFYEKKPQYIKKQTLQGVVFVDSLDNRGNVTWSFCMKDGKLLETKEGYNIRRSFYNYYAPKHPESHRVTTKYYLQKDSVFAYGRDVSFPRGMRINMGIVLTDSIPFKERKTIYRFEEEYNQEDSTYSLKMYNSEGLYTGGGQVYHSYIPEISFRHPYDYFRYLTVMSTDDSYSDIAPDGTPLNTSPYDIPNAMIVSITGERAHRLGLQNNDIIVQWDNWEYINYTDTTPDLNKLWLYTILTQSRFKNLIVLRNVKGTIQAVQVTLPKGCLDELQFTLLPAKVPDSTKILLSNFSSSLPYHNRLGNVTTTLILGIPENPYTHKPIVVYAAGHHPSKYYQNARPDTQHEWRFYQNSQWSYKNNYSTPSKGEKITAWYVDEFCYIKKASGLENDYKFVSVSTEVDSINFATFKEWEKFYLTLNRNEIELPLISDKEGSSWPKDVMQNTLKDKWYSWKASDNLPLTRKSEYTKNVIYKYIHWEEWDRKFIKGAKKSYIIPLDYSNEEQTLRFVRAIRELAFSKKYYEEKYLMYQTNKVGDYYILINYDSTDDESKACAKKGKVSKGSKIFIYDRKNRIAAYIER